MHVQNVPQNIPDTYGEMAYVDSDVDPSMSVGSVEPVQGVRGTCASSTRHIRVSCIQYVCVLTRLPVG